MAWVTALVAAGLATVAPAADRTDRGFSGGFVETPLSAEADRPPTSPAIWDLAETANGGFVGVLADLTESQDFFAAVRYRHNGAFDRGFGRDGFTRQLDLGGRRAQGQAIAVQGDGRILVAGFQRRAGRAYAPLLTRFRSDGSLDGSFGRGGIVAPKAGGGGGEVIHDLALAPGGRIIAVGAADEHGLGESGGHPAGVVTAYRPDGQVDREFGDAGRVLFPARGDNREYTGLKSVQTLPDGRLLVAGYSFGSLFLARLSPDGSLDPSFGNGSGTVKMFLGSRSAGCTGNCFSESPLAILPDGGIVALYTSFPDTPVLVRLHPDGSLDRDFGRGGKVMIRPRGRHFFPFDLAAQGRRIVLVGWDERRRGKAVLSFCSVRYLPDGSLDRSFGQGGAQTHTVNEYSGAFAALAQPDARVIAAGGGAARRDGRDQALLEVTRYLPG